MFVVDLFEIDAAPLVEEYVRCRAHNVVLLGALAHFVVIELVPGPSIQGHCRVVARRQLPLVVRDREQVIQRSIRRSLPGDDELAHVEALDREVD